MIFSFFSENCNIPKTMRYVIVDVSYIDRLNLIVSLFDYLSFSLSAEKNQNLLS